MKIQEFRELLITAHKNQRRHLSRILEGIPDDIMLKELSEERLKNMKRILEHIASAELYWINRAGETSVPTFDDRSPKGCKQQLEKNTEWITEIMMQCSSAELRIVGPSQNGGPTIAWALLRTYQHGIYHAGQLAKMRRILGVKELSPDDDYLWGTAVDSVINIVREFVDTDSFGLVE